MNTVDQLCPNCGLCCDSTLFADVELRAGDEPKRLAKLGLSMKKKGRVKVAFAQPCACFDGTFCKIYSDRPKRCRLFECGLLKKVDTGEMTARAALKKISKAKSLAKNVRGLLASFGQPTEELALSKCYSQAMTEPINLAGDSGEQHSRLMRTYAELMAVLQKDFLS